MLLEDFLNCEKILTTQFKSLKRDYYTIFDPEISLQGIYLQEIIKDIHKIYAIFISVIIEKKAKKSNMSNNRVVATIIHPYDKNYVVKIH